MISVSKNKCVIENHSKIQKTSSALNERIQKVIEAILSGLAFVTTGLFIFGMLAFPCILLEGGLVLLNVHSFKWAHVVGLCFIRLALFNR